MKKIPLTLRKYHFTQVSVTPIPEYDQSGDNNGTVTKCETKYAYDPENNLVITEVTIKTDIENSINPPYMYEITALGVFSPTEAGAESSSTAMQHSSQLLIGAIRQQILSITSSMPWDAFYHGFVVVNVEEKT